MSERPFAKAPQKGPACTLRPMRSTLLVLLLLAAGCAPSIRTLEGTCRDLSSPDPKRQDAALESLVDVYTWKHQDWTPEATERLAFCVPSVARLLEDADPDRRDRARHALHWVISMIGATHAKTVVPHLIRDAERQWAEVRHPLTKDGLPWGIGTSLELLGRYGSAARAALPLVEQMLADRELARHEKEEQRNPDGTHATDVGLFAWALIHDANQLKAAIAGP